MADDSPRDPRNRILRSPDVASRALAPLFADARIVRREVIRQTEDVQRALADAEERARTIVERAEAEAVELRQQAVDAGRAEGLRDYLDALTAASSARTNARADAANDMLELAFRLAARLVGRELDRDASAYADLVAACLRDARNEPAVTVRLPPSAVSLFESGRIAIETQSQLRFEPDPTLGAEDCVIETPRGTVDGRLQVRLQSLRRALRGGDGD